MHARLLAIAILLAACGGGTQTRTSTTTVEAAPRFVAPPRAWAEMDHDARRQHMVQHVFPATSELFAEWDAHRYEGFSCETCHGADATTRNFAMPNPSLITLYATGTIGQQRVLAEHTEACTFMYSHLVPAMQTMLGAADYDPATRQGFTCFACHPRGGDDDPLSAAAP